MTEMRRTAPEGLRWATGGGSPLGDCNIHHLAKAEIRGTLCGRYGPHTPPDPTTNTRVCRSCERVYKAITRKGETEQ
jgi:hypothetical protein